MDDLYGLPVNGENHIFFGMVNSYNGDFDASAYMLMACNL